MKTFEMMTSLAGCIETTFEDEGRPEVCFNGIITGDGVTAAWVDDCSNDLCGMTWVRLVNAYPSSSPGRQDQGTNNCASGIGIEIEVGVLRCTNVSVEDAEVEEGEALQATSDVLADMFALRKAISCCVGVPSSDMVLGNWTPMGPLGGLVGGSWLIYASTSD